MRNWIICHKTPIGWSPQIDACKKHIETGKKSKMIRFQQCWMPPGWKEPNICCSNGWMHCNPAFTIDYASRSFKLRRYCTSTICCQCVKDDGNNRAYLVNEFEWKNSTIATAAEISKTTKCKLILAEFVKRRNSGWTFKILMENNDTQKTLTSQDYFEQKYSCLISSHLRSGLLSRVSSFNTIDTSKSPKNKRSWASLMQTKMRWGISIGAIKFGTRTKIRGMLTTSRHLFFSCKCQSNSIEFSFCAIDERLSN